MRSTKASSGFQSDAKNDIKQNPYMLNQLGASQSQYNSQPGFNNQIYKQKSETKNDNSELPNIQQRNSSIPGR